MPDDDLPRPPQHFGRRRNSTDDTAILQPIRAALVSTDHGKARWPKGRQPEFDSFAILAVVGVLTIVALLGVIVASRARDPQRSVPPNSAWVPAPALGSGLPVPVEVQPATSTAASTTGGPTSGADPVPIDTYYPTAAAKPTSAAATSKTPAPPAPLLKVNTKISLAPANDPQSRLHHRYVWVRIDEIGSRSSPSDRASANYTVRKGLADPKCFSFESVDVPNNFMRHQSFVLYLQPNDRSDLFAKDATFCPVADKKAGTMVFQADNYPGYYLNERDHQMILEKVDVHAATAFKVRPAM